MSFNLGDHLYTERKGYTHHGIYIGGGEVIHYSGFANGWHRGVVEVTTLEKFANGHKFGAISYPVRTYNGQESVERAQKRLGEDLYDLVFNNCDAFVMWCIFGVNASPQVAGAVLTTYTSYALYSAGAAATASSLSGSGIIVSAVPLVSNPIALGALAALGLYTACQSASSSSSSDSVDANTIADDVFETVEDVASTVTEGIESVASFIGSWFD